MKKITITFLILVLIISVPKFVAAEGLLELETLYHIYKNKTHIGDIQNEDWLLQTMEQNLKAKQGEYPQLQLEYADELLIIKEKVFNIYKKEKLNDPTTIAKEFNIGAVANSIYVNNRFIGNLPVNIGINELTNSLVNEFKGENEQILTSFEFEQINNLKNGETIITQIGTNPSLIAINSNNISPDKINTITEIKERLLLGDTKKDDLYTIKEGDVLGSIAQEYEMSLDQLLQLNPKITPETVLQIGQKLNVQKFEPQININLVKISKNLEAIPYVTITKEDPNLFKGESYIKIKGQKGQKEVVYESTVKNNEITGKKILEEKIIKEKTDEVIVKGTKIIPSRGTGNFIWPTNGGFITSYQGMRWGSFHKGIGIAGPSDYSILAADNGTIIYTGYNGSFGNYIKINHNNGYITKYAHLNSISVKKGDIVSQGQSIGIMGNTGFSTGTHLDFEVYYNGALVNPIDVLP